MSGQRVDTVTGPATGAFHREYVERDCGTYTVEFFPDDCADDPRGLGTEALLVVFDGRGRTTLDEIARIRIPDVKASAAQALSYFLETYGSTEADSIERAYAKWRAITASPLALSVGCRQSNNDVRDYFALAEDEEIARGEADDYLAWALGEAFAYTVTGPDGAELDGCAGVNDFAWAKENWSAAIDAHEQELIEQAGAVGAGFVGVI